MKKLDRFLLPALLVMLVAGLRLHGITKNSITQDESTMVLFAKGVMERGYPFLRQVSGEFTISTYELVPFPIAASMKLFGVGELGARIPAVLFASGTVLLILNFGTVLFDRRVGVLASILFAFLPWAIYWGQNAFYPSQVCFFTLLTTMVVHRLLVEERPRTWVYYALAVTFGLSYLSWEGTGFLLPVFFVLLLAFRWGRFQWMANVHGWIAAASMILLIVGQLTYRTVLREPYVGIIVGRADVSLATIAFTSVSFDPYYYIAGLTSEAHVTIAWMLIGGFFLLHRSRWLRFLYLFVALVVLFLTAFLGYYALRYVYLTLPSLLLSASAVSVQLVDRLTARTLTWSSLRPQDPGTRPELARRLGLAAVTLLHLSITTPWGIKPLGVEAGLTGARPYELRQDLAGFPFRAVALALKQRQLPGDVVIMQAPFPVSVYNLDGGDYFLQSVTASSVFYSPTTRPYYTDKWVGNPVIQNLEELQYVLQKHARVWLLSAPDGASRGSVGADVYAWFDQRATLVVEDTDSKLFLYERPGASAKAGE